MRKHTPPLWSSASANGRGSKTSASSYIPTPASASLAAQRTLHSLKTKTQSTVSAARRRGPAASFRAFIRYLRRKALGAILIGRIPFLVVLIWCCVFYWGEVYVFDQAIGDCEWGKWETWSQTATPHHLSLIADPQLVDPHTYPSRPWPLSTLTVKHTDLYLRRSYSRIQQTLQPHTTIFLGDLFDGGREWATPKSSSPEEKYRSYKPSFWLREYERFSSIFLHDYSSEISGSPDPDTNVRTRTRRDGRRIIASLPGNHDLGFGKGIQKPVRERFIAFFGEGNRIDVIGNHSFVSLDSVSLSAETDDGIAGRVLSDLKVSEEKDNGRAIWGPSKDFLENVEPKRREAVNKHLRFLYDQELERPLAQLASEDGETSPDGSSDEEVEKKKKAKEEHAKNVLDMILDLKSEADVKKIQPFKPPFPFPLADSSYQDIPSVLLTHVPLYRPQNHPCGPYREKGNSIPISRGYQYQNTLSPDITNEILRKLGGNHNANANNPAEVRGKLTNVFSGDDHDYCDMLHTNEYHSAQTSAPGNLRDNGGPGVREITVKSISWAMGIRKPGFQLVSLWNPVDKRGRRMYASHTSHSASLLGTTASEGLDEDARSKAELAKMATLRNELGEPGKIEEGRATLQAHLCLLPDQLGILMQYGFFAFISLMVLLARAMLLVNSGKYKSGFERWDDVNGTGYGEKNKPLLPLSHASNGTNGTNGIEDTSGLTTSNANANGSSNNGISSRYGHSRRTSDDSTINANANGYDVSPTPPLQGGGSGVSTPRVYDIGANVNGNANGIGNGNGNGFPYYDREKDTPSKKQLRMNSTQKEKSKASRVIGLWVRSIFDVGKLVIGVFVWACLKW